MKPYTVLSIHNIFGFLSRGSAFGLLSRVTFYVDDVITRAIWIAVGARPLRVWWPNAAAKLVPRFSQGITLVQQFPLLHLQRADRLLSELILRWLEQSLNLMHIFMIEWSLKCFFVQYLPFQHWLVTWITLVIASSWHPLGNGIYWGASEDFVLKNDALEEGKTGKERVWQEPICDD